MTVGAGAKVLTQTQFHSTYSAIWAVNGELFKSKWVERERKKVDSKSSYIQMLK